MRKIYNVIVIGAGPAGCSAAKRLSQLGVSSVLLLEQYKIPRLKICAGGISPWVLKTADELDFPRDLRTHLYPVLGARAWYRHDRALTTEGSFTAGICRRDRFDGVLADSVSSSGVTLLDEARVDGLVLRGERVTGVRVGSTVFEARYVIVANGAFSTFHRDPREKRYCATMMGWFTVEKPNDHFIDLFFDKELTPFYGWIFPESAHQVNAGIGMDKTHLKGRSFRDVYHTFLEKHVSSRVTSLTPDKTGSFPILSEFSLEHHPYPGSLVTGEAERLVNRFTGEGISYAMKSGKWAADAVALGLKEGWDDETTSSLYVKILKRNLKHKLQASRLLLHHGSTLMRTTGFLSALKPVQHLIVRSIQWMG